MNNIDIALLIVLVFSFGLYIFTEVVLLEIPLAKVFYIDQIKRLITWVKNAKKS